MKNTKETGYQQLKNKFAAYQAILDHRFNDDLVLNAVNLLPYGYRRYKHTTEMLGFAINDCFDYKRPLTNYGGKAGDTIGGIVEKLVKLHNSQNRYSDSIKLINKFISKRENEINDHLLELLSSSLAEAYYNPGNKTKAAETLNYAIEKYNGNRKQKLRNQFQKYKGK